MNVPGDLVEHGLKHVDRDKAHAGLDESPGHEAALTEPGAAVAIPDRVRLLLNGKRLAGLGARHQPVGEVEVVVELLSSRVLLERLECPVHRVPQLLPPLGANGRDVIGRQQVGHLELRGRRVGVEDERVVVLAQVTGRLPVRQIAAGPAHRSRQEHVGRQLAAAPFQVSK
jgi:hypothetical protein